MSTYQVPTEASRRWPTMHELLAVIAALAIAAGWFFPAAQKLWDTARAQAPAAPSQVSTTTINEPQF